MEFAGVGPKNTCQFCDAELGKPTQVIKVAVPYTAPFKRVVEYVCPCPSCGKDIPLWGDPPPEAPPPEADIEPSEPAEPTEPPTEPATEPAEPTE